MTSYIPFTKKDLKGIIMYFWIYSRPLHEIIIAMFFLTFLWAFLARLALRRVGWKRLWKKLNFFLFIVSIILVLYITILRREAGVSEVYLMPFYSFVEAQKEPEVYRMMLMNMLLFMPIGLTCPYVLPKGIKKLWGTIFFAFLLSVLMEVLQFVFKMGRVETDDVLCNVLGSAIGIISYHLYKTMVKYG